MGWRFERVSLQLCMSCHAQRNTVLDCDESPADVAGVSPDADDRTIKKMYKRQAL